MTRSHKFFKKMLNYLHVQDCLGGSQAGGVQDCEMAQALSLIHISEPTRPLYISYAVFCLKKKNQSRILEALDLDTKVLIRSGLHLNCILVPSV